MDFKEEIVDYALPMMEIEKRLKLAHEACLKKDYRLAMRLTQELTNHALTLLRNIVYMKEKEQYGNPQKR